MKFALHSFLAAPFYNDGINDEANTKPIRVVLYEHVVTLRKELRAAHKKIEELEAKLKRT